MSRALHRRLDQLANLINGDRLTLVEQFPGMTRDEAIRLRFGEAGAPRGARLVIVENALPAEGLDYHWASERGTSAYAASWAALRSKYSSPGPEAADGPPARSGAAQ